MSIRSGGRLRPAAHRQVLDDMAAAGFAVLERTGEELVLGAIGRPWSPGGRRAPLLAGQADPAGSLHRLRRGGLGEDGRELPGERRKS